MHLLSLSLAMSLLLIQHVKIPSRWFTYQFLPSRGRELSAAVWTQLIHTLISSFYTHGRCLFYSETLDGFFMRFVNLRVFFHSSISTNFHRISQHSCDSFRMVKIINRLIFRKLSIYPWFHGTILNHLDTKSTFKSDFLYGSQLTNVFAKAKLLICFHSIFAEFYTTIEY